jgi:hypothetical protein
MNSIVSHLLNNESLVVYHIGYIGLFTAKFGKTINHINESDSELLVQNNEWVREIDYSLSANVIIWRQHKYNHNNNSWFDVFYAIPIDNR